MIKIATVGTSWITFDFIEAVKQTPGIELAGIYSRSADKGREAAQKVGAPKSWDDFSEMLADGNVDAVYIASPNALHYEQASHAIRAGKHVFVEKPATTTPADFADLIEQARDAGVLIFEAMRTAYDPGTAKVKELLSKLGDLRLASLSWSQRSSRYDAVLAGDLVNVFDPMMGGGTLLDLGVYPVSMMVDLFGMPSRVIASDIKIATGVEGAGMALAIYPGMIVNLSYSKMTDSAAVNEIQGEAATLTFDQVAAPRLIEVRYLDGSTETYTFPWPEKNMSFEVERFVELLGGSPDGETGSESVGDADDDAVGDAVGETGGKTGRSRSDRARTAPIGDRGASDQRRALDTLAVMEAIQASVGDTSNR